MADLRSKALAYLRDGKVTVGAGRRWYQRFRKAGLWAGIMMSLLLLVWLLVPGGPKEKIEPYRDQPRATHSE